jgi:hypothetical protein
MIIEAAREYREFDEIDDVDCIQFHDDVIEILNNREGV